MIRFLLLLAFLAWMAYTVSLTLNNIHLRRRLKEQQELMDGLHEPELWLPKREREAYARKLLAREEDDYIQQQIMKNTTYINQTKGTK